MTSANATIPRLFVNFDIAKPPESPRCDRITAAVTRNDIDQYGAMKGARI
jgi:hypothetical protein